MINFQPLPAEQTAAPAYLPMREMAFNGVTVTKEALRLRGFTSAEIDRHGSDAADLATSESFRDIRRSQGNA